MKKLLLPALLAVTCTVMPAAAQDTKGSGSGAPDEKAAPKSAGSAGEMKDAKGSGSGAMPADTKGSAAGEMMKDAKGSGSMSPPAASEKK